MSELTSLGDVLSYYPSCVVHLTIRYDEALQLVEAAADPRKLARAKRQEPNVTIGNEAIVTDATGTRSVPLRPRSRLKRADVNGQATASRGAGGQVSIPLSFGGDGYTVVGSRVPLRGSFELSHPRESPRWSMVFDYADLPIDPKLVRALGVEVHLGTVSADDYARGLGGERDADGRPLSILRTRSNLIDPFSGKPAVDGSTLLFFGVADQWDVEHDVDNGSTVYIEGRDIRSTLIDAKIPPAKVGAIDLTRPIDQVVADIIATMGIDHDLQFMVIADPEEWPNGVIPSPGDVNGLTRVRTGSGGDKPAAGASNAGKTTYWDIITNYCQLVGGMPQFIGTDLWIRPVKSVYDLALGDNGTRTPFRGGEPREVDGEEIRARRLVYGRDLRKLRFSRKFTGKVVPTIRCVSFDDQAAGSQRLIFGQWPPKDSTAAKIKDDSEVYTVPMYGIRSVERLTEIARGTYEEIGRGEMGGECDTTRLASYGGGNADPDLLRLRPMDPIEFLIDKRVIESRSPLVSTLTNIENRTFAEEVEELYERLGDYDVAVAITTMARNSIKEMLTYYQVIGVKYDWSEKGIKTALAFQNYIVPRQKAEPTAVSSRSSVKRTPVVVVGQARKRNVRDGKTPTVTVGRARSSGGSPTNLTITGPTRPRRF